MPSSRPKVELGDAEVDHVAGLAGGWGLARVTFKACSVQLLTRPWTSSIGLLVPLFGIALAAVLWQALTALPLLWVGLLVAVLYVVSALGARRSALGARRSSSRQRPRPPSAARLFCIGHPTGIRRTS